jgi:nucleotide-binding universal stress UspA family protein
MKRPRPDPASQAAGDAINLLLEAERQARDAIRRCEQEAAELLNRAREHARRVADRTDARISALHIRCDLEIAQRVAELRAAARQIPRESALDRATAQRLTAAVETLARRLTYTENA